MLKRWRNNFLDKNEFNSLKKSFEDFIINKSFIVFTPDNTGANWLGIKNATLSMYPNNTFILPQCYSNSLLSKNQLNEISQLIKTHSTKLVIFSGTPNYVLKWLTDISKLRISCGIIFHGGLAEMSYSEEHRKNLNHIIKLGNKKIISRIGVVKDGLDSWFKQYTNCEIFRVLPGLEIPKNVEPETFNDNKVHIGIFGNSSYNKNRHSQVAAASMIDNSIIHVLEPNEFNYGISEDRIIVHSNLNRIEFLSLLGSMDINLYCSFSESWGQVVLESLALNTPCLYSNNSGISKIINSDTFLVDEYDNILAIAEKIESVLQIEKVNINIDSIQEEIKEYNSKLVRNS